MVGGFERGITLGLKQGTGKLRPGDIFTELIGQILDRKIFEHASLSVGTTKDRLAALLDKAIREGQGIRELAGAIDRDFNLQSKVRSVRIARTELTDVINDGTLRVLQLEGFTEKEWSTVIDGRQRPDHDVANGQVVPIHQPFRVGGELAMSPGDPSLSASQRVHCRCAILGSGIPLERKLVLGRQFLRIHGNLERRFVVQLARAFRAQRDRILSQFPS